MRLTFLLGPAGTGKTFQCLHEIREVLKADPEGLPLIFLAPKQATFQLEYELLSDPELPGYTRLKILSFDALAELILQECADSPAKILNDEGRVMVLRALVTRHYTALTLFQTTARLPGFAQHLGELFRELEHYQWTPRRLREMAAKVSLPHLSEKLHDLALLLEAYQQWLRENELHDPNTLLAMAAGLLQQAVRQGQFRLAGLWLDGFAQMTPQEIDLLAALAPASERATLAFCLGEPPKPAAADWLSIWGAVGETFRLCHARLTALPGVESAITLLPRRPSQNRFEHNPVLAHLEQHWSKPQPSTLNSQLSSLTLLACPNPEAEAVAAAREILKHVQAGGRFRETAVLVRSLDAYHHVLRRVFTRYEIPLFLDQRESISHHPLSELTRYALRLALYGWEHDDWFGALKTGLVHGDPLLIDLLENAALGHGWRGREFWRNPISLEEDAHLQKDFEKLRQKIVPPFSRWADFIQQHQRQLTGPQLASGLRELWSALDTASTLEAWSKSTADSSALDSILHARIHAAVPQEMERWLENLELAFAHTSLPLADWLAIVDAGLAGLTVGVVPPALDQVLAGAVERSRNPDLKLLIGLGLNETIFPASPPPPVLLSESDRTALASAGQVLGQDQRQQIGRERFLGYILCTRSRDRLVLTYARRDGKDRPLNPSIFINHLQQLFPDLRAEEFGQLDWRHSLHPTEVVLPLLKNFNRAVSISSIQCDLMKPLQGLKGFSAIDTQGSSKTRNPGLKDGIPSGFDHDGSNAYLEGMLGLSTLPIFQSVLARQTQILTAGAAARLSPGLPEKLYGTTLHTSISDLEEYAACPFKFFVRRGLKAEEREQFEVDAREQGSFQHEIMMAFHRHLQNQGRRWRDISPAEARKLIARLGEDLQPTFRDGLFASTPERQFQAGLLVRALQDLITVLAGWAPQYQFEPRAVEIAFSDKEGGIKPWRIELDAVHALLLHGRIDRVDLHARSDGAADAVVIDYKSSGQELKEVKLQHGLDLQLLAYLGVLREQPDATALLGCARLIPAGAFYVRLRGGRGSGENRLKVLSEREETFKKNYQHHGRFNAELITLFDDRNASQGDQFKYRFNKNMELSKSGNEALSGPAFAELLEQIQNFLRRFGQEIYAGEVAPKPYRINKETACDHCRYKEVCRFDSWLEPYRVLKKDGAQSSDDIL